MNKLLCTFTATLLGSLATLTPTTGLRTAPAPGPGGVAIAVRDFLDATAGGGVQLAQLADEQHAVDFGFGDDGSMAQAEAGVAVPMFFELGADGAALRADTAANFVTVLGRQKKPLRTEVGTIRANCDSERCSWATVDFVRVYDAGAAGEQRVPMQATALLRYEGTGKPGFRIYLWHASRAATTAEGGDK